MKLSHFSKHLLILLFVAALISGISAPLLYRNLYDLIYTLNLDKNREQGERLATLISIELENGKSPQAVLANVQNMLESTPQSNEHFACIIKHENRVIAHPKPSNVNKDVTGWTLQSDTEIKTYTQSAGEGIPFGGIQTRLDGSQDITFQVPISTQPWSVAVHTKLDLVGQQARKILIKVAWFTLPQLLIIILLSAFFMTKREL